MKPDPYQLNYPGRAVLFALLCMSLNISCQSQAEMGYGKLDMLAKLPPKLNENSGIELMGKKGIWVIEDNGNRDHLYGLNLNGEIVRDLKVKNGKNRDWEDLAQDPEGNIYIGDFGNNKNDRKDLVVYIIPKPGKVGESSVEAKKIKFNYPEQKKFPPKNKERLFDSEAFFYWKENLFIVTKNRARPFNGQAYFYRIPAKPGEYEAELLDTITPCTNPKNCRITAADISPNGKTLALMSYGQLFLIRDFELDKPSEGTLQSVNLEWPTQMESVCFENNHSLLMSDEQSETKGRYLYRLDIRELE